LDRARWHVDFVDFWGVFSSVGRGKIDIFDGKWSFLGELISEEGIYGEGTAFFWRGEVVSRRLPQAVRW
jgi:hypothetical protein